MPLAITDVSVTVQPWTAGCGPHAFGFAAVLTAPANNVGGEVRYSWWFRTGESKSGSVMFAPGQTTQTVVAARTYYIQRNATASSAVAAPERDRAVATPVATPRVTPTPKPTAGPWPVVGPGGVYGVFYLTLPMAKA